MKRFLLFTGRTYYPAGGWDDFSGSFESESEARDKAKEMHKANECDWWQVIDTTAPH